MCRVRIFYIFVENMKVFDFVFLNSGQKNTANILIDVIAHDRMHTAVKYLSITDF